VTRAEWLQKAKDNADSLKYLLGRYYPAARTYNPAPMAITAGAAEVACESVRREIMAKNNGEPVDPCDRFDIALAAGDVGEINELLNAAWFGVPESTSCWGITGFREAVELIEDLPEDEA
jgi:hypothetical protein